MVAASGLVALLLAVAHPLHTTLTELTVDQAHHSVRAVVRVFGDDVGSALKRHAAAKPAPGGVSDAEATSYVIGAMSLSDRSARPLALHGCGVKRNADLLWVCVEADLPADARGVSLKNAVLCELYSDQVNIVQMGAAGATPAKSLLFTRGDGAKPVL